MKYRAEIDGLRALAVIPVILFHAGFGFFSGGFVGVDVFFVISGYLITTLLIEDIEKNRFSIVNFYERRARRILPALLVMLVSVAVVSWLFMAPNDFRSVAQQLVSNATFTSNIHYTLTWGYFEQWKLPPVFLNTWSLAVEEQFYIIIPLIIYVFRKKTDTLLFVFLLLSSASLLWAQLSSLNFSIGNYYLLTSRFWELAVGSILAIILKQEVSNQNYRLRKILASNELNFIYLLGLLLFFVYMDKSVPYPSLFTLIPLFFTACLIAYASPTTLVGRFFSSKYLVYIGKISYPLYLWHFPLFVLSKYFFVPAYGDEFVAGIALVLTVFLSIFTYHFVEKPFRHRTLLINKNSLLSASVVALSVVAVIGYFGHQRILVSHPETVYPELRHLVEELALPKGTNISSCAARNSFTQCQLIDNAGADAVPRKFLIIGDSFAENLIQPIANLLINESNLVLDSRVTYACSYMPTGYHVWQGECGLAREYVDGLSSNLVSDVIFHINYVDYLNGLSSATRERDLSSLTEMFELLIDKGISVHVIGHRNVFSLSPVRAFLYPWLFPYLESKNIPVEIPDFYGKWKQLGVNLIHTEIQIPDSDAYLYYSDNGHLSPQGSRRFLELQGLNGPRGFLLGE